MFNAVKDNIRPQTSSRSRPPRCSWYGFQVFRCTRSWPRGGSVQSRRNRRPSSVSHTDQQFGEPNGRTRANWYPSVTNLVASLVVAGDAGADLVEEVGGGRIVCNLRPGRLVAVGIACDRAEEEGDGGKGVEDLKEQFNWVGVCMKYYGRFLFCDESPMVGGYVEETLKSETIKRPRRAFWSFCGRIR
jgi:hypothetical protein